MTHHCFYIITIFLPLKCVDDNCDYINTKTDNEALKPNELYLTMALKYSQLSHSDRSSVSEEVGNVLNGIQDGNKHTTQVFHPNVHHNRTMPESILKDMVSNATTQITSTSYSAGRNPNNLEKHQRHHRGNSGSSKTLPGHGHTKRNHAAEKLPSGTPTEELLSTSFSPDDLAAQLTIMDQLVFRDIEPEELTSCSWNKKNKLEVAPNIVNLTRRFNHVSFWTVDEVLRGETPKQRAEVMAHFIRIAKVSKFLQPSRIRNQFYQ